MTSTEQMLFGVVIIQAIVIVLLIFYIRGSVSLSAVRVILGWAAEYAARTPSPDDDKRVKDLAGFVDMLEGSPDKVQTTYQVTQTVTPDQVQTKPLDITGLENKEL